MWESLERMNKPTISHVSVPSKDPWATSMLLFPFFIHGTFSLKNKDFFALMISSIWDIHNQIWFGCEINKGINLNVKGVPKWRKHFQFGHNLFLAAKWNIEGNFSLKIYRAFQKNARIDLCLISRQPSIRFLKVFIYDEQLKKWRCHSVCVFVRKSMFFF